MKIKDGITMNANLSIVLDKDKKIRLDLLQDVPLSQIDAYTLQYTSSNEIREKFKDQIDEFLEQHKDFRATFKKEGNKKGSLVIVYKDEKQDLHRMRVLYQENQKKMDTDYVMKQVFRVIRETKNPQFTVGLMYYFEFFLLSDYDKREVYKIQMRRSQNPEIMQKQNQRLLNLIRNHIRYAFMKDNERGYFYLRLLDAYLEKKGFTTTKRIINVNTGKIVLTTIPKEKTKLQKKKEVPKTIIPEQKSDVFFEDEDGQYSLFAPQNKKTSKKVENKSQYLKYEHFLDNEQEIKDHKK